MIPALVIHAPRDLRLEERPDPRAPGAGEVAVAIRAGGICGSDLHYYSHGGFGTVRLKEPMILGHEVAGEITGLGEGVTGLAVGDRVAVSPSRPCGSCEECLAGRPNHCFGMRFYGSAMPFPHIQGAFRGGLVARAEQCHVVRDAPLSHAAMAEPLAVVLHALRRAGDLMGRRVLITGCGPIGALAILAAKRAGAAEIVASDIAPAARARAVHLGADAAVDGADPDALGPWRAGKGRIDVMFECSGAGPALVSGLACIRPQGRCIQLGLGSDAQLPLNLVAAREVALKGAFRFHHEFADAVRMIDRGEIAVGELLTHTFPASQAVEAFETALDRSRAMKVQVTF